MRLTFAGLDCDSAVQLASSPLQAHLASYKDPILGEVNPIKVLHVLGVRRDIWLDLMLVKSHQSPGIREHLVLWEGGGGILHISATWMSQEVRINDQ